MKTFIKQHRSNLTIATIIALIVIASGAIWLTVRAAGFFAVVEPDNASLSANVKVVTDTTASGGKAIEFGTGGGVPVTGNFPTRDSVGPATIPTQTYNDCYYDASQSGQVIDGKVVNCDNSGGVRFAVDASNITFRNSIIRGQMFTVGNDPTDAGGQTYPRAPVFAVEDSQIIQSSTADGQDRALCCSHYVVKRSLIQGTHSGLAAHNNVVLEGNYITTDGTSTHQSGLRMFRNSVLRGNTVTCKPVGASHPYDSSGCSAHAVFYRERLDGANMPAYNLTIENNYFKRGLMNSGQLAGPYFSTRFVDCQNWDDCVNIKFTGNQFSFGEGTDGGEFPNDAGDVWSGNYWPDGVVATSGQKR